MPSRTNYPQVYSTQSRDQLQRNLVQLEYTHDSLMDKLLTTNNEINFTRRQDDRITARMGNNKHFNSIDYIVLFEELESARKKLEANFEKMGALKKELAKRYQGGTRGHPGTPIREMAKKEGAGSETAKSKEAGSGQAK